MKSKIDAQYIYGNGQILDNWACDVNPKTNEMESNGGQEYLVEYEGEKYIVLTDWNDKAYKATLQK